MEQNFRVIGMKEWFIPQISEHWPAKIPNRFEKRKIWLRRPGRASTLTPMVGTVHEWITSFEVTIPRIMFRVGRLTDSLVFKSRNSFEFSMNLSISVSFKEVCS